MLIFLLQTICRYFVVLRNAGLVQLRILRHVATKKKRPYDGHKLPEHKDEKIISAVPP